MILDHGNRYLLWGKPWIEQAGRAVFPLFALVLALGLRRDDGQARAASLVFPLVALGVVAHLAAMPLVHAGVRGELLNVLFTLACGCMAIASWRQGPRGWLNFGAAFVASFWSEYGPIGVALVLGVWLGSAPMVWAMLALLSVSQLTVVPLFVPAMALASSWLCGEQHWRSPRMLFGGGYVVQFAAFSAILWLSAGART